jgi:hypothetical protein
MAPVVGPGIGPGIRLSTGCSIMPNGPNGDEKAATEYLWKAQIVRAIAARYPACTNQGLHRGSAVPEEPSRTKNR